MKLLPLILLSSTGLMASVNHSDSDPALFPEPMATRDFRIQSVDGLRHVSVVQLTQSASVGSDIVDPYQCVGNPNPRPVQEEHRYKAHDSAEDLPDPYQGVGNHEPLHTYRAFDSEHDSLGGLVELKSGKYTVSIVTDEQKKAKEADIQGLANVVKGCLSSLKDATPNEVTQKDVDNLISHLDALEELGGPKFSNKKVESEIDDLVAEAQALINILVHQNNPVEVDTADIRTHGYDRSSNKTPPPQQTSRLSSVMSTPARPRAQMKHWVDSPLAASLEVDLGITPQKEYGTSPK